MLLSVAESRYEVDLERPVYERVSLYFEQKALQRSEIKSDVCMWSGVKFWGYTNNICSKNVFD